MKRNKEEDSQVVSELPAKRPRRGAAYQNFDTVRQCQEIFDAIRNCKLPDGRFLCDQFMRLPSKKSTPDYYNLVSNPIDLMKIHQKIKIEEYSNVEQMTNDVKLLVENSKIFYKKVSQEYKDACDLMTCCLEAKSKFTENADNFSEASFGRSDNSSPAPSNRSLRSSSPGRSIRSKETSPGRISLSGADLTENCILEQFLAAVLTVNDETGRRVCHAFVVLPAKEDCPDYYRVIKNPLDLKIIAERLRSNQQYHNLKDLEHDLNAMCRNAHRYNEPGSLIYKDASFLKRFITAKKTEFVDLGPQGIEKIKNPKAAQLVDDLLCFSHPSGHHGAPLVNALEEDSEDDDTKFVPDDKFSALYTAVRYAKEKNLEVGAAAMDLIEPFLRLPSRSFYPDYYDEIRQPMSLFIINRKIKMDEYNHFEEMVSDVNMMFNNAKLYNVEGSLIYTNASKLQVICNQKVRQLDPTIDTSQFVLDVSFECSPFGNQDNEDSTSSSSSVTADSAPSKVVSKSRASDQARKVAKLKLRVPYSSQALTVRGKPRQRPGRKSMDELMNRYRNKLTMLYKSVAECKDNKDRTVAAAFMTKPSKKLYPDYYEIIQSPIDLCTINANIEVDKYHTAGELIADVELLFKNARQYNEEKSQIWEDVGILEAAFKNALHQMGPTCVESPKLLKEKFGWYHVSSWTKIRNPEKRSALQRAGIPLLGDSVEKSPSKTLANGRSKSNTENQNFNNNANNRKPSRTKKQLILYNKIKDYADSKGRVLSTIFMKLPSKQDYPDYYDVIKKPIDMQKINSKIMSNNLYVDLDGLVQDFVLMFDNACIYNDPESLIYKDALTLQRVLLQEKAALLDDEFLDKAPDVHAALQELMTNLFITVYNYQDAEGHCYSDTLAELSDSIRDKENAQPPFSLDDIKRNIDRFRYRRLDRFQQDVFEFFEKARSLSRSDSEIFEDSVELQKFFIKTRNQLCNDGKAYYSPGLTFDQSKLCEIIGELRQRKKLNEKCEDATQASDPTSAPSTKKEGDSELDSVEMNGLTFNKNEFVYVKRLEDDKLEPHIMRVARIWRDASQNEVFLSGNWFYRPYETYHLATRKFLEKEVFRTDIFDMVEASRLIGKCYVMFAKDYFKFIPKNFNEKDVYCCESKYLGRMKHSFQRMTHWTYDMEKEGVEILERPVPFTPHRVSSVFVGDKKEEFAAASFSPIPQSSSSLENEPIDDQDYSLLDMKRQEVKLEGPDFKPDAGLTFFEQANLMDDVWLKLGDAVYLKSEKPLCDALRIEKIWRDSAGDYFVSGQQFGRPYDVVKNQEKLCYKRELYAGAANQTVPFAQLVGKCVVLSFSQYSTMRPVDIAEDHVYVCRWAVPNSNLVEHPDQPKSPIVAQELKSFEFAPLVLSDKVLADEIYFFKRPIAPQEISASWFSREENIMSQAVMPDLVSVANFLDMSDLSFQKIAQTIPKLGARSKSGYILFSAVIRRKIMHENPTCPFGQISKLVGLEWKRMSETEKRRYDEQAEKIAEARAKMDQQKGGDKSVVPPGHVRVWFCKWRHCDHQFETSEQLGDHITNLHTSQIIEGGENQFICLWQTCTKYKKDGKPFPSLPRLNRHMKDKHVQFTTSSKCILPQHRGKNFIPLALEKSPSPMMPSDVSQQQYGSPQHSQHQPQNAFPQQAPPILQQTSNQQSIPPQILRFQTPPPQQMGAPSSALIDGQGNLMPSGQQFNIYHIQQQAMLPVQKQSASALPPMSIDQQQAMSYQQNVQKHTVDPGRIIVQSQRQAEPLFVIPPQRIQRVLHSEVYLRYLESLNQPNPPAQPSISRWDRYLRATPQNTKPPLHQNPPGNFFDPRAHLHENKEQLTETLWNLRNHLMCDNLQLYHYLNPNEL